MEKLKEIIGNIEEDSTRWKDIWRSFENIELLLLGSDDDLSDEIRDELQSISYNLEEIYSPVEDIEDVIDSLDDVHTDMKL